MYQVKLPEVPSMYQVKIPEVPSMYQVKIPEVPSCIKESASCLVNRNVSDENCLPLI